jgi:hypothetical protein
MQSNNTTPFEQALAREPEWMQQARKAALRTPADTRRHDTRLRQGHFRNNSIPR